MSTLFDIWNTIQSSLFPRFEEELDPLSEKEQQFIRVVSLLDLRKLKWSSKNGHRLLSRLPEYLFLIFKRGFIPQGRVKSDGVVIGDVVKDLNLRRTPRDKPAI